MDQSKTVKIRIMQLSPLSKLIAPMTLLNSLMVKFTAKFEGEHREWGRRIREGPRGRKIGNFQLISRRISYTVQDRTTVTIND